MGHKVAFNNYGNAGGGTPPPPPPPPPTGCAAKSISFACDTSTYSQWLISVANFADPEGTGDSVFEVNAKIKDIADGCYEIDGNPSVLIDVDTMAQSTLDPGDIVSMAIYINTIHGCVLTLGFDIPPTLFTEIDFNALIPNGTYYFS
jgi:hypothetical protein